MAYINTTTPTRVWLGDEEVTQYVLSGSVSDDSTLSNSIIKTSGTITLGGVHDSPVVKFFDTGVPVGTVVTIQCVLANGLSSRHPRGTLYVINSNLNIEQQTLALEVGCSLSLASSFEDSFEEPISQLFNLVPSESLSFFDYEKPDLSTLSSILETLGIAIYQDKYGNVQKVKSFGEAAIGSFDAPPKFTSYDNQTAISLETISSASNTIDPARLLIQESFDLPKPDDEERSLDSGEPVEEQFVYTRSYRIKPLSQTIRITRGRIRREEDQFIRRCGVYINPEYIVRKEEYEEWLEDPDPCKEPADDPNKRESEKNKDDPLDPFDDFVYGYSIEGALEAEEIYFSDTIKKYQLSVYRGPGKQLSEQLSWEELSVWRYGSGLIDSWFNKLKTEFSTYLEAASSAFGEANEYLQIRDECAYWLNEDRLDCFNDEELEEKERNYYFYDCLAASSLTRANYLILQLESVERYGNTTLALLTGWRSLSNFNYSQTEFGRGGEVSRKVNKSFVHASAGKPAADALEAENRIHYEAGKALPPDTNPNRLLSGIDLRAYPYRLYGYFSSIVETPTISSGKIRVPWTSRQDERGLDPDNPVVLRSEGIDEYTYERSSKFGLVITEKSWSLDYETPENNTITVKRSTDGSTSANAEPRDESAEAEENPCRIPTEPVEIEFSTALGNFTETVGAGWLGQFVPSDEIISLPSKLLPLTPKPENLDDLTPEQCSIKTEELINSVSKNIGSYEKIIRRYLYVEAQKRKYDNRAVRITEKMRPELFDYYPYMPVRIIVNTNKVMLNGMAESATWAFDSSNCLCSFDCYVRGSQPISSATSPSEQTVVRPVDIGVSGESVINLTQMPVPSTASTVKITKLPEQGRLFFNGSPVTIGQSIPVSGIAAGQLIFKP
jgi:hypothetical protein